MIKTIEEYNKAKAELNDWDSSEEQGIVHDYCIQLSRDLLQYRRENNIFEVGDLVVHETYAIHTVVDVSEDYNYELSNFAYVSSDNIRHATTQEIKAGIRL